MTPCVMRRRRRFARRGFALLAVLWVTVSLSAIAFAGLLVARGAVAAARNRVALTRARWRAEDCLERARAVIDDALRGGQATLRPVAGGWEVLDHVVAASPAVTAAACDVRLEPVGMAVDVNAADARQLGALFAALRIDAGRADSMVDALLDWRDADDEPRRFGAERAWYIARRQFTPRNGPIADVRELRRIRGFDPATIPDSVLGVVLTVESGRILWNRAPLVVLGSVPGIGEEALARLAERRLRGLPVVSVPDLGAVLSPAAHAALDAHDAELRRLTTDRPDAWILTARGTSGDPSVTATIEVRLAQGGSRAATVRRRTTP